MTYSVLFLYLSVISMSCLIRHVSALNVEGIMHGKLVDQADVKYQAAILGRESSDSINYLQCSGTVIAPNWILSVASCFMITSEHVKNLIFVAILGSADITAFNANGFFTNIQLVYTYRYFSANRSNDITMGKTAKTLTQGNVNIIGIAPVGQSLLRQDGIVSGYGYSKFKRLFDFNGRHYLVRSDTDLKLRYTTVNVRESKECSQFFSPFISVHNKFCGVATSNDKGFTGACSNDAGSPLVILDKVVELSSAGYVNCDDTNHGSLYTNVSEYHNFINNVISNTSMDNVSWYYLRSN